VLQPRGIHHNAGAARRGRHAFRAADRKIGHQLCQNNDIVFENCRVPEENVFALGNGDLIISKASTWSILQIVSSK
jgi:alkylation response protein AidB-like acyl-CoA dehydrogenase